MARITEIYFDETSFPVSPMSNIRFVDQEDATVIIISVPTFHGGFPENTYRMKLHPDLKIEPVRVKQDMDYVMVVGRKKGGLDTVLNLSIQDQKGNILDEHDVTMRGLYTRTKAIIKTQERELKASANGMSPRLASHFTKAGKRARKAADKAQLQFYTASFRGFVKAPKQFLEEFASYLGKADIFNISNAMSRKPQIIDERPHFRKH